MKNQFFVLALCQAETGKTAVLRWGVHGWIRSPLAVRVDLVVDRVAVLVDHQMAVVVGVARLRDDEVRLRLSCLTVRSGVDLDASVRAVALHVVSHFCSPPLK